MISREQVADLIPGDVVHLVHANWPDGSFCQGPVDVYDEILGEPPPSSQALYLCGYQIRYPDGEPPAGPWKLQVFDRAPRPEPLYVNVPARNHVVPGDVVRDADDDADPRIWWADEDGDFMGLDGSCCWFDPPLDGARRDMPKRLRLLVDGETGQAVTS